MRTTVRSDHPRKFRRGAFTLVEIMVVITIMVALVALTAGAVLKYVGVQQTSNTQSTLDRVQSQLGRAWSKVKDDALKAPMTEPAYIPGTYPPQLAPQQPIKQWILQNLAGTDANALERTKVIYVKLKLRQAFPMSFSEALYPAPLPQLQGYVKYLTKMGIAGSLPGWPANFESAACLLMALQRGVSGAGIDPSQLTSGGAAGNYNGLPYLTDAWGRPIFFSRFPTGSLYLNPAGPLAGANDPGDPQGYLNSPSWPLPLRTLYSQLTLQQLAPPSVQPLSYKLAPMVASGGPSDWTKPGPGLTFDPITFAPVTGGDALFSTP
jgi:type II secretory pathway pseudopilin PulG